MAQRRHLVDDDATSAKVISLLKLKLFRNVLNKIKYWPKYYFKKLKLDKDDFF